MPRKLPVSAVAWRAPALALPFGNGLDDDEDTHGSPLVLDLDGDGAEAGAVAFFDHGGDGFMEATRWADEGDGVLAAGGGRKSPFCPPKLTFVPAAAQFA